MQPSDRLRHLYREDQGTRLSCFGCEKKRQTFHLFQEYELELGKIIAKNMARTARRQLGGRHLLFGEYLPSWTNLNVQYIKDELNIDAGKHVLASMFLNQELF